MPHQLLDRCRKVPLFHGRSVKLDGVDEDEFNDDSGFSFMDYGPPSLGPTSTARDYLEYWLDDPQHLFDTLAGTGYEPTSKMVQIQIDHVASVVRWLETVDVSVLQSLLPACRWSLKPMDSGLAFRLCLASHVRGVPSRSQLKRFAWNPLRWALLPMLLRDLSRMNSHSPEVTED